MILIYLSELAWHLLARALARPRVQAWLLQRSWPYTDILSADGTDVYMRRRWLINPYRKDAAGNMLPARLGWLPSVRLHHILREDQDRDLHDHPWNARTIILQGFYIEERPVPPSELAHNDRAVQRFIADAHDVWSAGPGDARYLAHRGQGYTGRLLFGQYHRIRQVSPGGVWTIFITWRKRGTWGFMVDGKKVPWREYLAAGGEVPPG